ncbi:hypothetical protein GOV04_02685 [Candidatus Woesearchaeota archaeon]|nr:hypothetical protein [Candidatus Woesearchaeota archaeon]
MEDEETSIPDQNEEYVNTPQNDLQQIEQIAREYESEPAKGISHGIQKDAIQNGVGARLHGSEPNSYKNWCFRFKLFKIDGKFTLSFTDEGTKGLTGELLSVRDIDKWSSEGKLTSEQNLSRFLTRFDSGGNYGPGSFGRGKLIFQAASKSAAILCDSLRYDDLKYIAFERKLIGNSLKQNPIPLQDEDAKQFVNKLGKGVITPLDKPGTRITIFDLKEEIVDSIINSFREDKLEIMNDYTLSFIKMIEESWWEIIQKFNAKITIEFDGKIKQVQLSDPLKSIVNAEENGTKWKIYKQQHVPIVVQNVTYKIKELRLALSPDLLDDDLRGFWIQRKRMKIGYMKSIYPNHTIVKKICGYVVLDSGLEEEIEKSEGTTHYSFNFRHSAPNQIRQVVNTHLQRFQERLGIRTTSDERRSQQDMLDAMKEINEVARKLGLISEFFVGPKSKDVEITIESFKLPHEGTKRIDFGDSVGPMVYEVKNNSNRLQQVELFLTAEQRGPENKIKTLCKKEFNLQPNERKKINCEPFEIETCDFRNGEGLIVFAKVNNKNSGEKMCQVSRMLWLGREEPKNKESPFTVTAYAPLFPRAKSNRVEITESIRNIMFKVSNKSARDVKINVDLVARKSPSTSGNVRILKEIRTEREFKLQAMSDIEFAYDALDISGEQFIAVNEGPANADERKCEIYFSVRLFQNEPALNMIKGQHLGKKNIIFYVGMDPPGRSIFNKTLMADDPKDGRRSWYQGDRASGYTFVLNDGHPSYRFANSYESEVKQEYIKEQMLCQAYAIAIVEQEFTGVAEKFKDILLNPDTSPAEAFLKIHEIVGDALIEMN